MACSCSQTRSFWTLRAVFSGWERFVFAFQGALGHDGSFIGSAGSRSFVAGAMHDYFTDYRTSPAHPFQSSPASFADSGLRNIGAGSVSSEHMEPVRFGK